MNNVQFATAMHMLTMLARTEGNLTSSYMAGSININAAMVRKALGTLVACGLVTTKEGKGGGASLSRPAREIKLSEVYGAVNHSRLLGKFNSPNPGCSTGRQVNRHLTELYKSADDALIGKLNTITLADFCNDFK